jgi:hypothetical protein
MDIDRTGVLQAFMAESDEGLCLTEEALVPCRVSRSRT